MSAVIEDVLRTRLDLVGLGVFTNGLESVARAFGLVDKNASAAQKRALSVGVASGVAAVGLGSMLVNAGMAAGRFDRLENSLANVLGSGQAAHEQMQDIQGTSASQLFGTENVARAALNLRNMGADASFTKLALEAAANATAAAGGDQAQFTAITEAVSRSLQMERVDLRNLRSIMNASGPAFKRLADSMGITVPQLEEIRLEGPRAKEALKGLLLEINRTQGGAAKSDLGTFGGQLDRLQNGLKDTKRLIGESVDKPMGKVAKTIADAVEGFNKMPNWVHQSTAGAAVAATLALTLRMVAGLLKVLPGGAALVGRIAGGIEAATPIGLTALAGGFAADFIPDKYARQRHMIQWGLGGMAIGSILGGLLGGRLGGAPGAAAGGAGGAVGGAYLGAVLASAIDDGKIKLPGFGPEKSDPKLTALQQIEQHLAEMKADIATLARGEGFSTAEIAGSFQALTAWRMAQAVKKH